MSNRTQPSFGDGSYMSLDASGNLAWFRADGTIIIVSTTTGGSADQYFQFTAALADASLSGKLFLSSTTANILKYYDTSSTLHQVIDNVSSQTITGLKTLSAASPLALRNAQTLTLSLTAQTVGAATLTIPDFASVNDTFAFLTLVQTFGGKKTFTGDIRLDGHDFTSPTATGIQQQNSIAGNTLFFVRANGSANKGQLFVENSAGNEGAMLSYDGTALTTTLTTTIGDLAGGGTNRPLLFASNGTEAFRITITPALQMVDAINIILGSSTGNQIGTAITQKMGFYGVTPIAQRAGSAQTAVATTASTQTTPFGYTTAAQADAIVTLVNELRAWAVAQGFIKGAA